MADDAVTEGPRRPLANVDAMRAGVVVVCFCVALGLLLGPAGNAVSGSSGTTTTTAKPPPPVNPSQVLVQVANGTSVPHLADQWTSSLKLLNWDALPGVDAAGHWSHTTIYYAPGFRHAGEVLATQLHVSRQHVVPLVPRSRSIGVSGSRTDDVVVVIGTHHAGQGVRTG